LADIFTALTLTKLSSCDINVVTLSVSNTKLGSKIRELPFNTLVFNVCGEKTAALNSTADKLLTLAFCMEALSLDMFVPILTKLCVAVPPKFTEYII